MVERAKPAEDEIAVEAIDAEELADWLDGRRPIAELRANFPCFATDESAVAFLDGVREGLADVAAGRTFTTDEVMMRLEEHRRARRAAA